MANFSISSICICSICIRFCDNNAHPRSLAFLCLGLSNLSHLDFVSNNDPDPDLNFDFHHCIELDLYIFLDLGYDLDLDHNLDLHNHSVFELDFNCELDLDFDVGHDFDIDFNLVHDYDLQPDVDLN